jgi:hypothetical protein
MNRIINWLLLIIIFVFDPLAIALVIAANFAFAKLRTHDALNELTKIQEEAGLYNNEGTDIYTEKELEELKDWDVTLMDGLEEEEFEDKDLQPTENDWQIVDEEPQIEVKMSGESSLDMIQDQPQLTEEEKRWDYDGDGILNEDERARYYTYKAESERFFKNQSISSDAKQRMRDYLDGKTKRYF